MGEASKAAKMQRIAARFVHLDTIIAFIVGHTDTTTHAQQKDSLAKPTFIIAHAQYKSRKHLRMRMRGMGAGWAFKRTPAADTMAGNPPSRHLWVGGLPEEIGEVEIKELFTKLVVCT